MTRTRPNILWITLDSVRADHTSLHGYRRDTTPELSRISSRKSGINFKHGIAHSTRTPVSVPSMLTGLYPSQHQMIGMRSGDMLPDSMVTVPELLAEQGYRTIAVSENPYAGKAKGFDKRFDDFIKSVPNGVRGLLTYHHGLSFLKYSFQTRKHGPGLTLDVDAHGKQNSFFTTDITKRKLRSASKTDKPFFCYVHYNDPHHEYIPPISYRDEYIDEVDATTDEAVAFAQQMHDEIDEWMAAEVPLSDNEWEMLYAMYDSIIKYTDAAVGELFDFVQDNFENTIVVVTADHGDLFGEYGLLGHHMVLHDGLIHVPLVTHGLEEVAHHREQPTQHIDVMQTLLSIADADTSQFSGYDLRTQSRKMAISQDLKRSVEDDDTITYERIRKHNPDIDLSHLPKSMVAAVRTTEFKYVHTDEWSKLYKLPNETDDVSDEYTSTFDDLHSFYTEWMATEGQPFEVAPQKTELTNETRQHLKEMGYL